MYCSTDLCCCTVKNDYNNIGLVHPLDQHEYQTHLLDTLVWHLERCCYCLHKLNFSLFFIFGTKRSFLKEYWQHMSILNHEDDTFKESVKLGTEVSYMALNFCVRQCLTCLTCCSLVFSHHNYIR